MPTIHTKVFKSNQSQAVRLPKAVSFPESVTEVEIIAIGTKRLIMPAGESWDSWFDGPTVTEDFLTNRDQPEDQKREEL